MKRKNQVAIVVSIAVSVIIFFSAAPAAHSEDWNTTVNGVKVECTVTVRGHESNPSAFTAQPMPTVEVGYVACNGNFRVFFTCEPFNAGVTADKYQCKTTDMSQFTAACSNNRSISVASTSPVYPSYYEVPTDKDNPSKVSAFAKKLFDRMGVSVR